MLRSLTPSSSRLGANFKLFNLKLEVPVGREVFHAQTTKAKPIMGHALPEAAHVCRVHSGACVHRYRESAQREWRAELSGLLRVAVLQRSIVER